MSTPLRGFSRVEVMPIGKIMVPHSLKFVACELARPLLQLLPAGRVRALTVLGGGRQNDLSWTCHPQPRRIFFDRSLAAFIDVDLSDWGGRWHYFAGRYYDNHTPWVIDRFIRAGDCFIDVGANIGIHTIAASRRVAKVGRVFAVEPNPHALWKLRLHCAMNFLENVEILPLALGAVAGKSTLHLDLRHLGTASLRTGVNIGADVTDVPVDINTLINAVPMPEDDRRVLVKIDVEGLELEVLRGAGPWLERPNTAFVVECTPQWIKALGGTPEEVVRLMRQAGFNILRIERTSPFYSSSPRFVNAPQLDDNQNDYLFVRDAEMELMALPLRDVQ